MLIIFDLDDTLIDTSGCITHYKLEDALHAMIQEGLVVSDFIAALDLLRRLNQSAESARHALAEFIEILGAESRFFDLGIKEIYDYNSLELPIFPLDGAIETLTELGEQHQLALVTVGKQHLQMDKLKKAGIDSRFFSKILVTEDRNKKPHYQAIVDELGYDAPEVVVCGDKIQIDLIPAKELGFKTVHMRWGRGLNDASFKGEADYRISTLKEIKNIVNDLMTFFSF